MSYELERSIGFKINQTANKINNKYTQILQSYNIAPEQRAVLEIIKYESDITQTKIATILGKDKTTISRTLNALETKGFIKKSQKDKRTNLIEITPEGEDILEKCSLCVKNFRQSLSSKLKEKELEESLEKVGISKEYLGHKVCELSGGEQQRIALARAILKNAPIVVLDEATAFADPENEYLIQKALKKLTEGKTVLMIAHRLASIKNVDCILVINKGKIEEKGKHKELIEKGGLYSNMWKEYNEAVHWQIGGELEND